MDSAKMCGFLVSGCLLLLLLTLLGDPTEACICNPRHPQYEYCYAGFVIKAIFLGSSLMSELKRYDIQTVQVFKGPAATQDLRFLYTPNMESLCGYTNDPTPGEEYLIAGTLYSDRAWISLCSLTQPWSALSLAQQRGISLYYQKGCRCSVDVKSNFQCPWDGDLSGIQANSLACLPESETPVLCTWQPMIS